MTQDPFSKSQLLAFWFGILLPIASVGEVYRLPAPGDDLIGEIRYAVASNEDTLIDIARENSVGQDEIVMANPDVDRWLPKGGTKVLIPRQFILPDAPRVGIVLNIPEMRLYYYPGDYETATPKQVTKPKSEAKGKNVKTGKATTTLAKAPGAAEPKPAVSTQPAVVMKGNPTQVITYPVSIGRMDWRTPLGVARIAEKVKDPVWRPPESIKKEHAKDGDFLPDVVPAGPMNPLGQFAMRLSVPGYLIHGTGIDKAYGIGMRVTHGCIRMYPEDIAKLFPMVNTGAPVRLVNQPVKLGWVGEDLYMEVHQPLDEDRLGSDELLSTARELIDKKIAGRGIVLDGGAVRKAVEKPSGIPVLISKGFATTQPVGFTEPLGDTAMEPAPAPMPMPDSSAIPEYSVAPDPESSSNPDGEEDPEWDEGI